MLDRTVFINNLIESNKFKSYLEVGYGSGANFKHIKVARKISIDPNESEATCMTTADDFFATNKKTFDIVFVDGMHLREYVIKDVTNSLKVLREGGLIVIHDCLPEIEVRSNRDRVTRNWQGDVWKAIVSFALMEQSMELFEVETGIVVLSKSKRSYTVPEGELTWKWYVDNFKNLFV